MLPNLQVSWEVLLIDFGFTYVSAVSFAGHGWVLSSTGGGGGQLAIGWPRMLSQLRNWLSFLCSLVHQQASLAVATQWTEALKASWDLSSALEDCDFCLILLTVVNYKSGPDWRVRRTPCLNGRDGKSQSKECKQGGKNNWCHYYNQIAPYRHSSFLQKYFKWV